MAEDIFRRVVESELMGTVGQKKKAWKSIIDRLSETSAEFERVLSGIGYRTTFSDLSWACKKKIFEMVVRDISLEKGIVRYEQQELDCKRLVQCKTVNKLWKYWIGRSISGIEMRRNKIDIDI